MRLSMFQFPIATDQGRKIIGIAQKEAERYRHSYIGTEHLLLAVIMYGKGVVLPALNNLGVDAEKIRNGVEKLVMIGKSEAGNGPLPFTPQSKRLLEYATTKARALHDFSIGPEHIFLGLIQDQDSVASQVMINLGLKIEHVRDEIIKLLGESKN